MSSNGPTIVLRRKRKAMVDTGHVSRSPELSDPGEEVVGGDARSGHFRLRCLRVGAGVTAAGHSMDGSRGESGQEEERRDPRVGLARSNSCWTSRNRYADGERDAVTVAAAPPPENPPQKGVLDKLRDWEAPVEHVERRTGNACNSVWEDWKTSRHAAPRGNPVWDV
ncbi:hypothetical protein GP486_002263 [Trichoglossum hirsutum]|uniref:Uncharacterized protein n=1 Tax=Trichoglossum hirsutum TaxID=265104 RepID=A0A9P8RRV5_9PEZI|nr:hypothetical protein GP486_002263 [Trichoglossum hirsutum]